MGGVGFMKEIYSEIEINASAEVVWRILMDFKDYPRWNPFMKQISGNANKGSKIKVFLQPPNSRGMTFKPKILECKPNKKLRWIGHLFLPKIFDGEHSIIIKRINNNNNVLFIQREKFTGIIVPFLGGICKNTQKGFEMMNLALKKEAESV